MMSRIEQIVESNQQFILNKSSTDVVQALSQQDDGNVLEWPCLQRSVADEPGTNQFVLEK